MQPMTTDADLLLGLNLAGTFFFALNGSLTAVRHAKLDIVGVVTLGMITGLGGGIIRDILIGDLPPATFRDWRYLAIAAGGGLVAFFLAQRLARLAGLITVFDAAGLGLFAVTGATTALAFKLGAPQAVILGAITGVGGGTLRDVLLGEVPTVLRSELYAIPALLGAAVAVATSSEHVYGPPAAVGAALSCFVVRMVGAHFGLNAPRPRGAAARSDQPDQA